MKKLKKHHSTILIATALTAMIGLGFIIIESYSHETPEFQQSTKR